MYSVFAKEACLVGWKHCSSVHIIWLFTYSACNTNGPTGGCSSGVSFNGSSIAEVFASHTTAASSLCWINTVTLSRLPQSWSHTSSLSRAFSCPCTCASGIFLSLYRNFKIDWH